MKDKIFVVPDNDAESVAIWELLKKLGYAEGVDLFVTHQAWGASWENLKPEIKEALQKNAERTITVKEFVPSDVNDLSLETKVRWNEIWESSGKYVSPIGTLPFSEKVEGDCHIGTFAEYMDMRLNHPAESRDGKPDGHRRESKVTYVGVSEPEMEIQKELPDGIPVYGIELQGQAPEGAANIDHHVYGQDDRYNSLSSIEQVAQLIGAGLTRKEQLIAANDKGFIPAMEELGANQTEIQYIRSLDRAAQGIAPEQEKEAEKAIADAHIEPQDRNIIIHLPHSKCATVTDRLYGQYDNLLCICGDGESDFYGSTSIIAALNEKFPGGWAGGDLAHDSGFWGGYPDQKELEDFIAGMYAQIDAPETQPSKESSGNHRVWENNPRIQEAESKMPQFDNEDDMTDKTTTVDIN